MVTKYQPDFKTAAERLVEVDGVAVGAEAEEDGDALRGDAVEVADGGEVVGEPVLGRQLLEEAFVAGVVGVDALSAALNGHAVEGGPVVGEHVAVVDEERGPRGSRRYRACAATP